MLTGICENHRHVIGKCQSSMREIFSDKNQPQMLHFFGPLCEFAVICSKRLFFDSDKDISE